MFVFVSFYKLSHIVLNARKFRSSFGIQNAYKITFVLNKYNLCIVVRCANGVIL